MRKEIVEDYPQTVQFVKIHKGFLKYSCVSLRPEKMKKDFILDVNLNHDVLWTLFKNKQSALHGSCYIMNIASLPGFKPCFTIQTAKVSIKYYGKTMRKINIRRTLLKIDESVAQIKNMTSYNLMLTYDLSIALKRDTAIASIVHSPPFFSTKELFSRASIEIMYKRNEVSIINLLSSQLNSHSFILLFPLALLCSIL